MPLSIPKLSDLAKFTMKNSSAEADDVGAQQHLNENQEAADRSDEATYDAIVKEASIVHG